jgi:hypothetical protein
MRRKPKNLTPGKILGGRRDVQAFMVVMAVVVLVIVVMTYWPW